MAESTCQITLHGRLRVTISGRGVENSKSWAMMAFGRVPVCVVRFQETIINSIGVGTRCGVRAKHDAILVFEKETSNAIRLTPEFVDPRVDVDVEVGILIKLLPDDRQVFGIVPNMGADKRCVWMLVVIGRPGCQTF